jgi:hypothetical protein
MNKKNRKKTDVSEEIVLLDEMLSALVEVLEEKGVILQDEWEQKIKEKIKKRTSLKAYSEL